MNYWITTHWPHTQDQPIETSHEHVYVQDGKQHVINRVSKQDKVFIYETRSGRTEIHKLSKDSVQHRNRHLGREGIVGLVEVTEPPREIEGSTPEHYVGGQQSWWRYYAPTRPINSVGFVPRNQLNAILGYSDRNVLRGFGDSHSGLKQIDEDIFNQLLSAFNASTQQDGQNRSKNVGVAHRFGSGGEGPEHRALKNQIAADPVGTLNEPGLILIEPEMSFPTGDRIDVVLKDRFGRFVAVEVEVSCNASEMAGPLQCMKYRAMLSYLYDRPLQEVRCILVAHSIHTKVNARCVIHNIETKLVPHPTRSRAATMRAGIS